MYNVHHDHTCTCMTEPKEKLNGADINQTEMHFCDMENIKAKMSMSMYNVHVDDVEPEFHYDSS